MVNNDFVDRCGIIFVLKIEHKTLSSGHKNQILLEETDLYQFQKDNLIDENFCRKNPKSDIQMKFSCNYCR